MAISLITELINFEQYYEEHIVDNEVLWVNDLDYYSDTDRQLLREYLFTTIKSSLIKITPSCRCGNLEVAYMRGLVCDKCNTVVEARFGDLTPIVWLRQLDDTLPFVSPHFVSLVTTLMGTSSSKLFRWFGDSSYDANLSDTAKIKDDKVFNAISALPNFTRSYRWLLDNFKTVMICIMKEKQSDKSKSKRFLYLIDLWDKEQANIITPIIPVVHKSLIVVEKSTKGSYIQSSRSDITNAVETFLRYVDSDSTTYKDRATAITVQLLSDMYLRITTDFLSGKQKLLRKNFMGARLHFSLRQVVTPINGPHIYDEVHLPWQAAVVSLRPHIINKLTKQGIAYKEINLTLFKAITRYDERIDNIFKEIIEESNGGLPVMVHRNPSQNSASIHLLRATKVKTDVEDKTISLSTLLWVFANGDFDGDESNLHLLIDEKMKQLLESLRPHHDVFAASKNFGDIFGKVSIPETAMATLISRAYHEREKFKEELKK